MESTIYITIQVFLTFLFAIYSIGQSTLISAKGGFIKIFSKISVQSQNLNIGSGSQFFKRNDITTIRVPVLSAGILGQVQRYVGK